MGVGAGVVWDVRAGNGCATRGHGHDNVNAVVVAWDVQGVHGT